MPFGLIFGALFFGLCCGAMGLRWVVHPTLEGKLAGALFAVLGAALALGLLMRRRWARWAGVLVGAILALLGLRLAGGGGMLAYLLFMAATAATVLLVLPPTGDPTRGAPPGSGEASKRVGAIGWTALASFTGLLAIALSTDAGTTTPAVARGNALPAAAIGKRIRWNDFAAGLALARREGKPVLATFVTDWCPYCTKMASKTWRSSAVAERSGDFVLVKIDAEEDTATEGVSGRELARRYGVSGFPVQVLLDAEGRAIARYDGYQGPRELLKWLDAASRDESRRPRQGRRVG